ncbi:MAG: insulinase family protein [Bacteroidales bacterium]|jgi:zinc protease
MRKLNSFLALIIYLVTGTGIFAQADLNMPAPNDPDIRTGKLPNGLTWFIRKNSEPEKRASFYIIQNVGAILENDNQNGLAHFLEHMAFNGTEHFPGKGIISGLEKHGVAFGYNINAYTSYDETVYNLSNVPSDNPALIDTCLMILHDWSHYITLDEKEIDQERGVIVEEWRRGEDANTRMFNRIIIPVVLKGSKYALRDVIGDPEIVKSFSYGTLRDFYHQWYRPDLQAIAVVGDINADEVESEIKEIFSKIPAVENPSPRYFPDVPYHKETYYVLATDKEAPQNSVSIVSVYKNTPPESRNLKYLRDTYIISLMNSMMNARIGELLQKANPPFISGSVYAGSYIPRKYDAFTISAMARKNEEAAAFEAVYTEAARARKFGFGKNELDRAKAKNLSNLENTFKQKDKISNDTYVSWIEEYFLRDEPATSADFDLEFFRKVMDGITPEEVTARYRELMTDENRTIVVQGVEGDDTRHLSEADARNIIDKVNASNLTPYEDIILNESLVNDSLKGCLVIKTASIPKFDAVEWTLANGAKVVYRKADYEKDNILLSGYSFGGISRLDNDLVLAGMLTPSLSGMYGAGDFNNVALQKMLAGKKATVMLTLGEVSQNVSGSATPRDLETMMQLLYLKLAKPRFDQEAHNAIIARYSAMIASQEKNPDKIKNDSITLIITGHNPRTVVLTKDNVSKITLDQVKKVYNDRFSGADKFIFFVVGNVDKETVMPLVEKYIGSLPVSNRQETWIDRKINQPKGKIVKEIRIPLAVPKSTVFLAFSSDMKYKPYNYLGLQVIQGILDLVYTAKVREDEAGTYGVSVSLSESKRPEEKAEGYITFDCSPERADNLKAIIYNEIDSLVQKGPGKENLDKTVSNLLKTREENKMHNSFWNTALNRYYSYGININDPKNFEDILKSFTVDDIRKLAGKMFKKADIVDLIFKPAQQ